MNDTSITIRMNSETKTKAQELFNSLGLDMSTAINLFLNEAIEFQGIPFIIQKRSSEGSRLLNLETETEA